MTCICMNNVTYFVANFGSIHYYFVSTITGLFSACLWILCATPYLCDRDTGKAQQTRLRQRVNDQHFAD